jgi:cytochrome c oxidase subunit 2
MAIVAACLVGGCFPASPTTQGRQIGDLYRTFFLASIVVAGIVWTLATWAILRYRRRNDRIPKQVKGNLALELTWTAIPLVTVLVLFWLTFQTINSVQAVSPEPGVAVHVTAFRWQWRFDYTGQDVSVIGTTEQQPELVVPIGEPIHVTLDSVDVAHSFYVPAFLFKRDAIPGLTNRFDFDVDTAGTYPGECAEFCGVFHATMRFTVRAVSAADYATWLEQQPKTSPAPSGPSSSLAPSTPSSSAPSAAPSAS